MSKPDFGEPWEVFEHADQSGLEIGPLYKERILKGQVDAILKITGISWNPKYQRACGVSEKDRSIAQRVKATVNACAGLTDEELKRVRAVNEMYEACKKAMTCGLDTSVRELVLDALALADGREQEQGNHE